ncbi:MAG: type I glyceraldehyde-3-phosphate dehydrogenase [Acidimicrobiia bacterium]|nr:type I glyceraldehyde-3-phosphate dehydrogenase [Acidimicrobiia bacterium]
MTIRVAINGFGRIGRLAMRVGWANPNIEFVAVNDLVPADGLAYLFEYDTVHGRFESSVEAVDGNLVIDGKTIRAFSERNPEDLPWDELKIDYVIESTGIFTDYDGASKHLAAGAKRVVLSAPTKSPDKVRTFAYKVNHTEIDPETDVIISNASCTTNCLAPLAKVLNDEFGIVEGLVTTVHSVTASQPTQDSPSKKDLRGGRNGYANIIPGSTGAAKAVVLTLPELEGKLDAMAFRVPTPDVSVVDLTFRTETKTSLDEINAVMKKAAEGAMAGVLEYTEDPIVSSDLIGNRHSSIYDAKAGIELNDQFFKVIAWYDNEIGYSARLIDMLEYLGSLDDLI